MLLGDHGNGNLVELTLTPYSAGIDPRTVKVFVLAGDPYHRYSNESEKPDYSYDDIK